MSQEAQPNAQNQIATWAIVEIMGHQRVAGYVSTQAFGGTVMLQVDVPELPEKRFPPARRWDFRAGKYVTAEQIRPVEPAITQWIGMGSIYRLTPCTEETARAAAENMRRELPKLLHVSEGEIKQLPGETSPEPLSNLLDEAVDESLERDRYNESEEDQAIF